MLVGLFHASLEGLHMPKATEARLHHRMICVIIIMRVTALRVERDFHCQNGSTILGHYLPHAFRGDGLFIDGEASQKKVKNLDYL
jgi:hypothetical protein